MRGSTANRVISAISVGLKPRAFRRRNAGKMMERSNNGFTLIELLVVIAVIGILVAIIIPVLARARDRAQSSRCLSNLRQIAVGVQMYLDDHNDRFPPVTKDDWQNRGFGWISEFYLPYVNDDHGIFRCSAQTTKPEDLGARFEFPSSPGHWVTYEYNRGMSCDDVSRRVSATSRDIMIPSICPYVWDYPYYYVPDVGYAHRGGMNVVYADCHAAWVPADDYAGDENRWYNDGFVPR